MPHLILVKHALPEIIPTLPANQWHLSEAGRTQCALLADQLATYAPDVLVSSSEPKALETAYLVAQRMHTSVQTVDGLHEHDRSNTPWLGPERLFEKFRPPRADATSAASWRGKS
jgi:broad specificity phosphatase PhoE